MGDLLAFEVSTNDRSVKTCLEIFMDEYLIYAFSRARTKYSMRCRYLLCTCVWLGLIYKPATGAGNSNRNDNVDGKNLHVLPSWQGCDRGDGGDWNLWECCK